MIEAAGEGVEAREREAVREEARVAEHAGCFALEEEGVRR